VNPDIGKTKVAQNKKGIRGSNAGIAGGDDGLVRGDAIGLEHPQQLPWWLQKTVIHA